MKPPPEPHYRHRFAAEIIASLSGYIRCSASACGMSSCSWPELCQPPAPPTATARGQVAPARGVRPDPWRAALSLARRGSARRCARHPRSGAPRCQCRQALLQAPADGPGLCAAGDRDRPAEQLRRGEAPPASRRRAATKPISEQPRRKLTSTDAASGTADATVQIARAGPGLTVRSRIHPWPLPPTPPSDAYRVLRSVAFEVWHHETCARHAT